VLDDNPNGAIRVTDDITYVIQNGRIHEGSTLSEKPAGQRKLEPLF